MNVFPTHIRLKFVFLCLILAPGFAMAKFSDKAGVSAYEVLGIDLATAEDQSLLRKAYARISKDNHPDLGGSTEKQGWYNDAYAILKDPDKRKAYNEGLLDFRGTFLIDRGQENGTTGRRDEMDEFEKWELFFSSAYASRDVFMKGDSHSDDTVRVLFELLKFYRSDVINMHYNPEQKRAFRQFVREGLGLGNLDREILDVLELGEPVQALRFFWTSKTGVSDEQLRLGTSILKAFLFNHMDDDRAFERLISVLEEVKSTRFMDAETKALIGEIIEKKWPAMTAPLKDPETVSSVRRQFFRFKPARAAFSCVRLLFR